MSDPSNSSRKIRLFVSSTFRDMQAEREHLTKVIFPQLQRLCESRRLEWSVIDLRWGITEEQSQRGEVLSVCLEEIDRCRPFFIGILGQRYGWRPEPIVSELINDHPWLSQCVGRSVTEMEIIHGALREETQARAQFYFRDSHYAEQFDATERDLCAAEDAEAEHALAELKERIRESRHTVREGFRTPQELGQMVLTDITSLIDELYSAEETPSPLELARMRQQEFAIDRTTAYVPGKIANEWLQRVSSGEIARLAVVADGGMGKSALLANWKERLQQQEPNRYVLYYADSSTTLNADESKTLGRSDHGVALAAHRQSPLEYLLEGLNEHFHFAENVPRDKASWPRVLQTWLAQAANRGGVVLLLDGVDRFSSRGLPTWLPREDMKNVSCVVACRPGEIADALEGENWKVFHLPSLEKADRRKLIDLYLSRYGKSLGDQRAQRVVDHEPASNPLFLRTLLDELRVFGVHELIDERLDYYLQAVDTSSLYELAITQWEEDYSIDRPGLVRDTLCLLAVSRHGLHETELRDVLGGEIGEEHEDYGRVQMLKCLSKISADSSLMTMAGTSALFSPLPQAQWSPLLMRAEHAISRRGGLLRLENDEIIKAIERMFLSDVAVEQAARLQLVNYFKFLAMGARRSEELPWQLLQAERWSELRESLAGLGMFTHMFAYEPEELKGYWEAIGGRYDMVQTYVDSLTGGEFMPVDDYTKLNAIVPLLQFIHHVMGRPDLASPILNILDEVPEDSGHFSPEALLHAWLEEARVHIAVADLDQAVPVLNKAWMLAEKCFPEKEGPSQETPAGLVFKADLVSEMARVLRLQGRHGEAIHRYEYALQLMKAGKGSVVKIAEALFHLGQATFSQGQRDAAENHLRESLELWEHIHGRVSRERALALHCLAQVLGSKQQFDEAERLHAEALAQMEEMVGPESPMLTHLLNGYAIHCRHRGDPERAKSMYRRALSIGHHSPREAAVCMTNLAITFAELDRFDEAHETLDRALEACQRCKPPDQDQQLTILQTKAEVLMQQNSHQDAVSLLKQLLPHGKSLGLQKELEILDCLVRVNRNDGNDAGMTEALLAQAEVRQRGNDLDGALSILKHAVDVCPKDEWDLRNTAMSNLAIVQIQSGDQQGGIACLNELEAQGRRGDCDQWAKTLRVLVYVYQSIRADDRVASLLLEQENACAAGQDVCLMVEALMSQTEVAHMMRDWERAKAISQRGIEWCRRHKLVGDLARFCGQQGVVLSESGDHEKALALHREAASLAEAADFVEVRIVALTNVAASLDDHFGRLNEARMIAQSADRLAEEFAPHMRESTQRCLRVIMRRIQENDPC
ncbi:tetratricopeptide repeat protein [Stieleria varia]|uniref:Nephrocystin-3 n=1 Tax=Stieleria varia TaxID=2528005 RepID=A0A5C6AP21_9BACT|nr:tetratricopeptide repeat protein [Stieleria varia]TWU00856.1 Tetratricopeptide repeat protein [Stieleria varia]